MHTGWTGVTCKHYEPDEYRICIHKSPKYANPPMYGIPRIPEVVRWMSKRAPEVVQELSKRVPNGVSEQSVLSVTA